MAFLGLRVPLETARLLSEVPDVAKYGDPEPLDRFHVTLLVLGDIPIEDVARTIEPVFKVVSETRPFTVSTSHITTFPPGETTPIIGLIDSPEIHVLRARLTEALGEADIEYNRKFKDYVPHVTLGYSAPDLHYDGGINVHLPVPISWGAHELVLWGGHVDDQVMTRVIVTFPFSLGLPRPGDEPEQEKAEEPEKVKDSIRYKAAVRLAMHEGQTGWPSRSSTASRVLKRYLGAVRGG
jgi:2'-5' RNA ligase